MHLPFFVPLFWLVCIIHALLKYIKYDNNKKSNFFFQFCFSFYFCLHSYLLKQYVNIHAF